MRDDLARVVAELTDQLISVQFFMAGGGSFFAAGPIVQSLYRAAREKTGQPLTYAAARGLIDRVKPGDYVIVSTGFPVPPVMIAESDGPIGAVTLARALDWAFGARVILVTELANLPIMEGLLRVAGLNVVYAPEHQLPRQVLLLPFPLDEERARRQSKEILDRFQPKAIITVEKPSRNRLGVWHNGAGINMTGAVARVDDLIDDARERGIFTVGIGDGGNEIGMGNIEDTVRQVIPPASSCGCPCGGGTAAHTQTDVCVVASLANWGAYGVEAVLAVALGDAGVLHPTDMEDRLLLASTELGFVDPTTAYSDGYVDGLPPRMSSHIVDQLNVMVSMRLQPEEGRVGFFRRTMKEDREQIQQYVDKYAARWLEEEAQRNP